jgi:hypothetical protein
VVGRPKYLARLLASYGRVEGLLVDTGAAETDFAGCYSDIAGCCGRRSCLGTVLMMMMQLAANHRSLAGRWTYYLLECVPYCRSVLEVIVKFEACAGSDSDRC